MNLQMGEAIGGRWDLLNMLFGSVYCMIEFLIVGNKFARGVCVLKYSLSIGLDGRSLEG